MSNSQAWNACTVAVILASTATHLRIQLDERCELTWYTPTGTVARPDLLPPTIADL